LIINWISCKLYCGFKFRKHYRGCVSSILAIGLVSIVYIIINFESFRKKSNSDNNSVPVRSNSGLENSSGGGTNIIDESRTYDKPWREPYAGTEYVTIARIMVENNITGCGIFYVKEVKSGEYVVACSDDAVSWTYYVVYSNLNRIYLANDEMITRLKPPAL
jgi:hypothetical protein